MSRRIHVLPDAVANQIAAGEVVERPASVVKELVENALDAGARRIDVEVGRGGRRLINVTDDGSGMSREDALLSLERHATSKIQEARDLQGVRTLGFRGEALPSIAAVSRLTLTTREADDEVGTQVKVTGGTILSVEDAARRPGTTVEVRDLFFNAPARRKFLRAAAAETRAVSDAIVGLALAHPGVAFHLQSDQRVLLDLPATEDLGERIRGIWGSQISGELIATPEIAGEGSELSIRGLVQRPDVVRPGHRRAFLFVNGRAFREPALLKAVDRAYRTTVPPGHRPWLFLYLDVPGGEVDVNVHPAKAEVRFRYLPGVEEQVERVVRSALAGARSSATLDREAVAPHLAVREGGGPWRGDEERSRRDGSTPGKAGGSGKGDPRDQMALFVSLSGAAGGVEPPEAADRGRGDAEGGAPGIGGADAGPDPDVDFATASGRPRLWQVLDTYILAETRSGVLIIDQHSAHERVLFEELMDRFDEGGQGGQRLLFPMTIRLTPAEYAEVDSLQGMLARTGFEVEGFGGDTVIVQAVPNPHPYFDAERCFREMIEELTEGSPLVRSARNQHERIAKTFACKGAIKAGQRLTEVEMQELFDRLFATELPFHDVHGRPTIVKLSAGELERKFGR